MVSKSSRVDGSQEPRTLVWVTSHHNEIPKAVPMPMASAQQEPGNQIHGGNPTALKILIGLILLETALQGWSTARWHLQTSPALLALNLSELPFPLATAWGLWYRKAWGWWLAAILSVFSVSMFLLGRIWLASAMLMMSVNHLRPTHSRGHQTCPTQGLSTRSQSY